MSLVKIRFEIMNEVQFSRAFESAATQMKDLSPAFEIMAKDFYETMAHIFEAEGAYEEREAWQDLSPAYAIWKKRHYPGRKILELTGRMKRSLTVPGTEDGVLNITPEEMTIGTRLPYAVFHQTGRGRLPQRKIIELTDKERLRWTQIMSKFLFGIIDDAARNTRS